MTIWGELDKFLHLFTRPVLSFADADGFPFSFRCQPRHDREADVMHVVLPGGVQAIEGPSWLLWHSHDERLAAVQALAIRGRLYQQDGEWLFRGEHVVPGPGLGPGGWGEAIEAMHRDTQRYLERNGLVLPDSIPWEDLEKIARRVERERSGISASRVP